MSLSRHFGGDIQCTNDVCNEGEGGGQPNSDKKEGRLREFGTDKGREGVQNPKNLEDVICTCPLLL